MLSKVSPILLFYKIVFEDSQRRGLETLRAMLQLGADPSILESSNRNVVDFIAVVELVSRCQLLLPCSDTDDRLTSTLGLFKGLSGSWTAFHISRPCRSFEQEPSKHHPWMSWTRFHLQPCDTK